MVVIFVRDEISKRNDWILDLYYWVFSETIVTVYEISKWGSCEIL